MKYQKNRKSDEYYVGLDIGDGSIGYAVTDTEHNLCFHNGKPMSGSLLFEPAETAEVRRGKRTARRRLARRRERIDLLQQLFAEAIGKIDDKFFIRLNESGLWAEDKTCEGKFSLFNDKGFTDKEFYKQYPTIYHLCDELIRNGTSDPRLLYLACHHLVKYRGHFLFEGQNFSVGGQSKELLARLNMCLADLFPDQDCALTTAKTSEMEDIFIKAKNPTACQKALAECLEIEKGRKLELELLKAISGNAFSLETLFGEDFKGNKAKFDSSYETWEAENRDILGDDVFTLIDILKELSDFRILNKLLSGEQFVSRAMIGIFNKHKNDLKKLKQIYAEYMTKEQRWAMFKLSSSIDTKPLKGDDKKQAEAMNKIIPSNYCAYAGINKSNSGRKLVVERSSNIREDFFKTLKKELEPIKTQLEQDERFRTVYEEVSDGTFLPKIVTSDNSVFPYQVNEIQLNAILDKCLDQLPFLKQEDNDTDTLPEYKTVAAKIRSLLLFRIPYYVGPLNPAHKENGGHAWVARLQSGKVTPWNFHRMVDSEASAQGFINNLVGKCSYLKNERVLPKDSLLYAKYNVLNQLNTLQINGNRIDAQVKIAIYEKLFCIEKSVTLKRLQDFLVAEGYIPPSKEKNIISGIVGTKFACAQRALIQLRSIFGEEFSEFHEISERIVYLHSVYTDKSMFIKTFRQEYGVFLKNKYGNERASSLIKTISRLSFHDFGNLSHRFLSDFKARDVKTGKEISVIDALYQYPLCLNELLHSSDFTFRQELDRYNEENAVDRIDYHYVNDLYVSPSVKRGIWQANLLMDEIVHVMGNKPPKRIFIEVTRSHDEKKKGQITKTRKQKITEYYKAAQKDGLDLSEMLEELNRKEMTDAKLRSDRLFLYFMQLGRCAYSGKRIDLDQLFGDLYDIDHIIPQALLKDDSITNRVLTLKTINSGIKKDNYPLPHELQSDQNIKMWQLWQKLELISGEKLARLKRNQPVTNDELEGFVNRQLVTTAQAAIEVARMFELKYKGETRVVYAKAENVSYFRNIFDLHKCREANNLHHANDAYLNVVVGNVYDSYFMQRMWQRGKDTNPNKLDRLFRFTNIPGVWDVRDGKSIRVVKENLAIKFLPVSKKVTENSGALYDETVYGKHKPNLIPKKETGILSDVTKYGGYNSGKIAYFVLVESDGKKGTRELSLEAMPVRFAQRVAQAENGLVQFFESKECGLKNVKILYPKIRSFTLLQIGSSRLRIRGKTGLQLSLANANEWYCSNFANAYLRTLVKYKKLILEKIIAKTKNQERIEVSTNEKSGRVQEITRQQNLLLYDEMIEQLSKKIYKDVPNVRDQSAFLKEKRDVFMDLDTSDQAMLLLEVLKFLQCNPSLSDMSLLGGKSNAGVVLISKNLSNTKKDMYIIEQSISGLYEKLILVKRGSV